MAKDYAQAFRDLAKSVHTVDAGRDVAYWLPTGLPTLDLATGTEGIPSGRLTLILGTQKVGKSTTAMHLAGQCCKAGGSVAWADNELSWYEPRAVDCGVDPERLALVRPMTLDATAQWFCECAETVPKRRRAPFLFVWDNTSAKGTASRLKARKAGKPGQPGDTAKALWTGMRDLMGLVWEKQIVFIAIAQLTERIGVTGAGGDTFLGEKPLGTAASITLKFYPCKRPGYLERGDGQRAKVLTWHNRFHAPFKTALIDVLYHAPCVESTWPLLELALERGVVTGGPGGVYEIDGKRFKRAAWPEHVPAAFKLLKEGE